MGNAQRVKAAIAVVSILIGAFSGYIKGIAPPEDNGKALAVGMVALSSVFAILLIEAIGRVRKNANKIGWFVTAVVLFVVAVGMFFVYAGTADRGTFSCPPGSDPRIIGELTPEAKRRLGGYGSDLCQMLPDVGGVDKYALLSVPGSIETARQRLRLYYFVFVLSLLSAIFALTDGVFGSDDKSVEDKDMQDKGSNDEDLKDKSEEEHDFRQSARCPS